MTTRVFLESFPIIPGCYLTRHDVLRKFEDMGLSPTEARSSLKMLINDHYVWRSAYGFGITAYGRIYLEKSAGAAG